jgi:hypothetical protein
MNGQTAIKASLAEIFADEPATCVGIVRRPR